jgi:hypothetical protein
VRKQAYPYSAVIRGAELVRCKRGDINGIAAARKLAFSVYGNVKLSACYNNDLRKLMYVPRKIVFTVEKAALQP